MATVTGLTAARMLEIEAASVVDGEINEEGHLILTKHDGTEIDAGNALVAVPEENVVHQLDPAGFTESTPPSSYPVGISTMLLDEEETESDWETFSGQTGSILTVAYVDGSAAQIWKSIHGDDAFPEMWHRSGTESGGWSLWKSDSAFRGSIIISSPDASKAMRLRVGDFGADIDLAGVDLFINENPSADFNDVGTNRMVIRRAGGIEFGASNRSLPMTRCRLSTGAYWTSGTSSSGITVETTLATMTIDVVNNGIYEISCFADIKTTAANDFYDLVGREDSITGPGLRGQFKPFTHGTTGTRSVSATWQYVANTTGSKTFVVTVIPRSSESPIDFFSSQSSFWINKVGG